MGGVVPVGAVWGLTYPARLSGHVRRSSRALHCSVGPCSLHIRAILSACLGSETEVCNLPRDLGTWQRVATPVKHFTVCFLKR